MVVLTERFEEVVEEVVVESKGVRHLDTAQLLKLADSMLDRPTSVAMLEDLGRVRSRGSTSSGDKQKSCHRTEEVSWHVKSSRKQVLELACDVAFREGFSKVQWKRNFSALHLAAKLGSSEHVRRLLQEANATSGLAVRDDFGKLPIDYAFALPEMDLELLDMLDPANAAVAPRAPASPRASPRNARLHKQRASHAASEPRTRKICRKLPTVPEETLPLVTSSSKEGKSKAQSTIKRGAASTGLPTLLGSHGFAQELSRCGRTPGQVLAQEVHYDRKNGM